MVLAVFGYVEERGSGSPSTSRPWRVTSSEWSGHGWTRCWSHRLSWPPLPPLHEATGAVASPLMPTRKGYGTPQRPHRPHHKPQPEQPNPSRLTALTPQNQPERPLLRGNQLLADRRTTLKEFMDEMVVPFFYRLLYIDAHGLGAARQNLWPEYSHGDQGLQEYFSDVADIASQRLGRNDPCACGSGRKYKRCHLGDVDRFKQRRTSG